MASEKSKIRILSIDGGGIRGILPAVILEYLELELNKAAKQKYGTRKEYHLSDFFDFVAGTSTGGILTIMYLLPNARKHPTFSAPEVTNFYMENGGDIFQSSVWTSLKRLGGLADEKYSVAQLERLLEENLSDKQLSTLLKPSLITSYDIENRRAVLFTSHNAKVPSRDFPLKSVARATSAAPTYFEPAKIRSINGISHKLVDGGMFANNPTLCAYSEVKKIKFSEVLKNPKKIDCPAANDMIIVSLGTGSIKQPYEYEDLRDAGALTWVKPVIDILMSSNAETTSYHVGKIFKEVEEKNQRLSDTSGCYRQYFRIEPHLYDASDEMDDASPENLQALREAGLRYIDEYRDTLHEIIDVLLEND